MSQPAANVVANLLSKVARYSVFLGIGGSALQASLYTGVRSVQACAGQSKCGMVTCVLCIKEMLVEAWLPYAVDGGERAVMYDRIQGVLPKAVTEGTHFRVPWLQSPAVMDIRTRPRSISSVTGTKGCCTLDHSVSVTATQAAAALLTATICMGSNLAAAA